MTEVDDLRIDKILPLDSPQVIRSEVPLTDEAISTVVGTRKSVHDVLHDSDDRLVVVVGPCSIHDADAALEYARLLVVEKQEYKDNLIIVMRVYFEKPRTTIGWKGLINDPDLNETFNINKGIRLSRTILRDINDIGIPTATEFLDLITPQYIAELVSWGAIGARTTESQGHRELASGISCPIGFKNGTTGDIKIAIDAIRAASQAHHFMSLTKEGRSAAFSTTGNRDCHIILRGGIDRPNYDAESVEMVVNKLRENNTQNKVMIDFSHANSHKNYKRQYDVCADVCRQISRGNKNIMGVMIESHLVEGNQSLGEPGNLVYGQSITDACVGWDETKKMFDKLSLAVEGRRHS